MKNGFTLVELAIVMIIIGLLLGGVLKGQELIENSRTTATIAQIKGYMAAYNSFIDTYGGTAGDMSNATTRLQGCTGANNCVNGQGNSIVGDFGPAGGGFEALNQAGVTTLPRVETSMFWKHLALADLITGIDPTSNPTNPAWGESHPSSALRGGYHIFYSASSGDYGSGHVLRLQSPVNASASSGGAGAFPLSPIRARAIDLKMDDGMPDQGSVTADFAGTNCDNGGVYQNLSSKNCIMYFAFD